MAVAPSLSEITAREQAGIVRHPGFAVNQGYAVALVDFQLQLVGLNPGGITVLAEGGNNGIGLDDEFAARNRNWAAATAGIRIAQLVANDLEATDMHAIVAQNFKLRDKVDKLDMLKFGLVNLILVRTHLLFRAAIEDVNLFRTKANGGAAAVHCGKTTAQDDDLLADKGGFAKIGLRQQADAMLDAFIVRARNNLVIRAGQRVGDVAPGGQENGIVLLEQVGQHHVATNARVVNDLDAHIFHVLGGFLVGDGTRQTPDGDTVNHHTTSDGISLVNGDGIPHVTQVASAGEASRTSANDSDFFIFGNWRWSSVMPEFTVIGGGTFQPADGDGLAVNFIAAADRLAWTSAGTAKHARHHIAFAIEQVGFVEARLRDQADIGGDIGMRRTAHLAGNICLIPIRRGHHRLVSRFQLTIRINHEKILS